MTEGQVHKALYLLGLGLREGQVEVEHCHWLEKARAAGVLELVVRVAETSSLPQHVRGLAEWVVSGEQLQTCTATQHYTYAHCTVANLHTCFR